MFKGDAGTELPTINVRSTDGLDSENSGILKQRDASIRQQDLLDTGMNENGEASSEDEDEDEDELDSKTKVVDVSGKCRHAPTINDC